MRFSSYPTTGSFKSFNIELLFFGAETHSFVNSIEGFCIMDSIKIDYQVLELLMVFLGVCNLERLGS